MFKKAQISSVFLPGRVFPESMLRCQRCASTAFYALSTSIELFKHQHVQCGSTRLLHNIINSHRIESDVC